MRWSQPLSRPVGIIKPKKKILHTIDDARRYMLTITDGRERREYWQHAAKLVLEAAAGGGIEAATRQLEFALLMDGALDLKALTL